MKEDMVKINEKDYIEEEVVSLEKTKNYTYDIEVEDNHHYILSNGIISHNTISYLSECSSGIEPAFALAFTRRIEKDNNVFEEVYLTDNVFEDFLNKNYKEHKEEILKDVVKNGGSCQQCKHLTDEDKRVFKTSQDISPMDHLKAMECVSYNVNSAVSKTINLPKNAKPEDVSEVYLEAWKRNIIGVTVYRDGTREGILITNNDKKDDNKLIKTKAPKRPTELPGELHHITLNKQKYYVAVGMYDGEPIEVFTGTNYNNEGEVHIPAKIKEGRIIKKKQGMYVFQNGNDIEYELHGYHAQDTTESLTRQISLSLRHGTAIHFIIEQLQKIKAGDMFCFSRVLARTLKKYVPDNTESTTKCDSCGSKMVFESSCLTCKVCGNAKCG